MGNGHAPGTAIGLGATGVEIAMVDFGTTRLREAGFAVFFFAAFFTAGFLAGFFLMADLRALVALVFASVLRLAIVLRASDLRVFAAGFFLGGAALRTAFLPADFFFAFAIRTSVV
jgi:hypothetical protein